jgi:hypothetical protein
VGASGDAGTQYGLSGPGPPLSPSSFGRASARAGVAGSCQVCHVTCPTDVMALSCSDREALSLQQSPEETLRLLALAKSWQSQGQGRQILTEVRDVI